MMITSSSSFMSLLVMMVIIIAVISSATCSTAHEVHHPDHTCIHDTVIADMLKKEDAEFPNGKRPTLDTNHEEPSSSRSARTLATAPIRIVTRTDSLFETTKYCANPFGTVDDQLGGKAKCSEATVLTEAKRNILTQKLLPAAFALLRKYIKVNPVVGPIKVPSTVCKLFDRSPADGSVGVSDADTVLYVSAAPTDGGEDWATTYAWAASCMTNNEGRPVVARANFNPKFLQYDEGNTREAEAKNRNLIRSVTHELLHALGLSSYVIFKSPRISDVTVRGKPSSWFTGSTALARYRTFSGCSTVNGIELEDQPIGSDGSIDRTSGHWERRNMADSIMVGAAGGEMAFDEITLAALEDSGYYFITDYSLAEKMTWGEKAGCSFLTQTCGPSSPQMGSYWCQTKAEDTCTYDRRGYGTCSIIEHRQDIFPSYFQYFSNDARKGGRSQDFMDYCSSIVPYRSARCNSPDITADESGKQRGEVFGYNGRCISTDDLAIENVVPPAAWPNVRCVLMRCPAVTPRRLQLRLQTGNWFDCPKDGSAAWIDAPTGYKGKIYCEAAATMCSDPDLQYSGDGSDSNPSNPASSPPNAATTTPPPPIKPPTAAIVITVLKITLPFDEDKYKKSLQEITTAKTDEIKVINVDDSTIRVEFTGDNAALHTNQLVTAPTAQLRLSGFMNATAAKDNTGNNAPNNGDGSSDSMSWLPFPLYVFLAITIGGGLLIVLIICCVCIQWRRKRAEAANFDTEGGNQNLAQQYKAWAAGDEMSSVEGGKSDHQEKGTFSMNNINNNNSKKEDTEQLIRASAGTVVPPKQQRPAGASITTGAAAASPAAAPPTRKVLTKKRPAASSTASSNGGAGQSLPASGSTARRLDIKRDSLV